FSLPGDNFIDHLVKLNAVKNELNIDLYVLLMSGNDIFLNRQSPYWSNYYSEVVDSCSSEEKPIYDQTYTSDEEYSALLSKAWQNASNRCVADRLFSQLPTNSVVLLSDHYSRNKSWYDPYFEFFENHNVSHIDPARTFQIQSLKDIDKLYVSSLDGHPSALAHKIYAELITNYISTSNILDIKWQYQ
ncbi:hypothetical protein ACFL2V_22250, partial [Pseudomonadota bacterium]